jgi:hypothetical protein
MKTDLTKCYAGLSLKERAGLAFEYSARLDDLEVSRIVGTVPTATFTGVTAEFRRWSEAYLRLTGWWSLEHWRTMARRMSALGGMTGASAEIERGFQVAAKAWESQLMALDRALDDAGAEHGFDPEAVRAIAGADRFMPIVIEQPEPEHVVQKRDAVARILAGQDR